MNGCNSFCSPYCDFNNTASSTDLRWSNNLSGSSELPSAHEVWRNPYVTLHSRHSYQVPIPSSPESPSFPTTPRRGSPLSISAIEVFNPDDQYDMSDDPFAKGNVQIVRSSPSLLVTPPVTPPHTPTSKSKTGRRSRRKTIIPTPLPSFDVYDDSVSFPPVRIVAGPRTSTLIVRKPSRKRVLPSIIPPPTPPPTRPLPSPVSPSPSPRQPALGYRRMASRKIHKVPSSSSTSNCESGYDSATSPCLRPASRRIGSNGRDSPSPQFGSGSPGAAHDDGETDSEECQLHPAYRLFSRFAHVATPTPSQQASGSDNVQGDANPSVWRVDSDDGDSSEQETDEELDQEDAETVRPVDHDCDRDIVRDCSERLGDHTSDCYQWPGTGFPVSYRRCRSCSLDTVTARLRRTRTFRDNEAQTMTVSELSEVLANQVATGAAGAPTVIVTATTPSGLQQGRSPASELQVEHDSDPFSFSYSCSESHSRCRRSRRHFPGHLHGFSDDSIDQDLDLEHWQWEDDKPQYMASSGFSSRSAIGAPTAF
jgi:hypothetical protein